MIATPQDPQERDANVSPRENSGSPYRDDGREPTMALVGGRPIRVLGIPMTELIAMPEMMREPDMVAPFIAAAGTVTMIAGREKSGKSTLAAFVCSKVTQGGTLWGEPLKAGNVLWVGLEEQPAHAVKRFNEMGADISRLVVLSRLGTVPPVLQLEAEIAAHHPKFVVIDSLTVFFREIEDENSALAWTRALMPLVELARLTGTAIVVLHHAAKATGTYRGSTAIGAEMDMILEMFEPDRESTVRQISPRGRWALAPYSVRYEPSREWTLIEDGTQANERRDAKQRSLQDRIRAWLAAQSGPVYLHALRAAMGGNAADVDAVVAGMVECGEITHLGKRRGYVLSETRPAAQAEQDDVEGPELPF